MSIADAKQICCKLQLNRLAHRTLQDITIWVVSGPGSTQEGPGWQCLHLPGGIRVLGAIERDSEVKSQV